MFVGQNKADSENQVLFQSQYIQEQILQAWAQLCILIRSKH